MNWFSRVFAHYEAYHAYGPPRLKYMGYLGAVTYIAFFFLRFTRSKPEIWDDIGFRLVAVALFLGLGLKDHWPRRLKPYYIRYSYGVLLYCLPCFTVLVALERGGGVPAISNAFIVLCFLVMLTDWRNTLVMLAAGTGLAALWYALTVDQPRVPMDLVSQLPAYALIVIGGNLFKFSTEQIDAERKLRATQGLAGSIAHELRHPLAQVHHSLQAMQRVLPAPGLSGGQLAPVGPADVDTLYRHLAHGEQAVQRGLQVISMTLDEVSARPLDTASFSYLSAAAVVSKAVEEYGYDSEDECAAVAVQVQEDFQFRGDETACLFVLFNLIKNALYYLRLQPGTRVWIMVGGQQVRVRDNGPGIAPEVLPTLFEPFRSVGKSGGTGLGLAYCQRVMKAFGGTIRCQSQPGAFTEFTLQFPAVGEQAREEHHARGLAQARDALAGKRLLMVEDDAAQRALTRHKLRPVGLSIDEAADGQRALDLLARHAYDLVLLDLNMPVVDGYQVAQRLRQGQAPANRYVRIVAHTSEPAHVARVKTQRAGIDSFVAKPSDQLPLVQALVQALQRQGAEVAAHALAGRRVLLADDSAYNRRAVAAYLREAGAEVVEVDTGQAALQALGQASPFDAVLMDLGMPGMGGLDTARAVRASRQPWSGVPILALTAHSDAPAMQGAREAGMDGFLVKPVEAMQLYEALGAVLAGGAAQSHQPTAAAGPAGGSDGPLLNEARLESYRRLGLLDELLADYLPEIARLVGSLEHAVRAQDLHQARDALHSLLGMSGEAGALALYQQVRQVYVPVLEESRWPAGADWLQQVQALAARTDQALRDYGARHQPREEA
ncbi:response regulator [Ramlibacter tataouinensis]|uniref:ATP-binding response regulator n=1 Tax=Ramlibacter tataouinensis TaxID=94132 RepID=UPI0022F3F247|nr:hybrid sensor histidine kinase/response regulator [Ramlibacter tataouinensis]WBY01991.1 response regulator [Ramlibacter tataouinensis]